jgi:ubiquinone/menaquinone biosynthesis C-methylase UbiE
MVLEAGGGERVEVRTGGLYGSIWNQLSDEAFEEVANLHWNKFVTAGFGDGFLQGRVCLDAGCGSGRAVRSMLKACAARVEAVDVGEECIANTRRRNAADASRLNVTRASVLNLPFPDNYFDFVHCDGVLHHTTNPFGGLQELRRVAKPGAPIFFGLYGAGGLLNATIYSARRLSPLVPRHIADRVLSLFTADPIKHYVILDCFYVPIREKYRPAEIEDWARRADIVNLRRVAVYAGYKTLLERITKDYSSLPRWFSGEGYLMYAAEKPRAKL